jgi:hypothetical protein
MSDISVRSCDGCGATLSGSEEGMRVACGCTGEEPPSRLLDYCPECDVPSVRKLAKLQPGTIIQSVDILLSGKWIAIWKGSILFDPEQNCYTDGYERVLSEEEY